LLVCPLVIAGFIPHPPLLIEGIGDEQKNEVAQTHLAYLQFAQELVQANPATLVVVSPHGPMFSDAYTIAGWDTLKGDFTPFGSLVSMTWQSDREYGERAEGIAETLGLPLITITSRQLTSHRHGTGLDHGTMVPLWYLREAGWDGKVVCVRIGGLPPAQCYQIGKVLAQAVGNTDTAIISSGDLSHCLTEDAPSPYNPAGAEFDQTIIQALAQGKYEAILSISPDFRQRAAECGWRPLVTLLGALDGRSSSSEVLSYEGPFGVGYLVATFKPGPEGSSLSRPFPQSKPTDNTELTKLARDAIRYFLMTGNHLDLPLQPSMARRAGVFVSLKLDDQLRGCIGTIEPEHENIAQEIIANAVSAASQDPRFEPVTMDELDQLTISVDVLSEPVAATFAQLDPATLGLVAEWKGRRGLLLPDLSGVDSPEEQLGIVCQKAGIPLAKAKEAKLFTFLVERYQ
jgi:AmmeMemoRadiSam system protein A